MLDFFGPAGIFVLIILAVVGVAVALSDKEWWHDD